MDNKQTAWIGMAASVGMTVVTVFPPAVLSDLPDLSRQIIGVIGISLFALSIIALIKPNWFWPPKKFKDPDWPTRNSYLGERQPEIRNVLNHMIHSSEFRPQTRPGFDGDKWTDAANAIAEAARNDQLIVHGRLRGTTKWQPIPALAWKSINLQAARRRGGFVCDIKPRYLGLYRGTPTGGPGAPPDPIPEEEARIREFNATYDCYIVDALDIERLWSKRKVPFLERLRQWWQSVLWEISKLS